MSFERTWSEIEVLTNDDVDERLKIESSSILLETTLEERKKERAHKGGAENVGLQTKSSLGLDFRTTGWLIYRGDGSYPN